MDEKMIGAIAAGIVAIAGIFLKIYKEYKIKKTEFQEELKKIEEEKQKKKEYFNKEILLEHEFFHRMPAYSITLNNMTLKTKGRTLLFRVALHIFFQEFTNQVETFISKTDKAYLANLFSLIDKLFYDIIKETLKKWETAGINEENGLEIVPLKIFNWSQNKQKSIMLALQRTCLSENLPTLQAKLDSILTIFIVNNDFLMADAEIILNSLNGEISGKKFQGKTI